MGVSFLNNDIKEWGFHYKVLIQPSLSVFVLIKRLASWIEFFGIGFVVVEGKVVGRFGMNWTILVEDHFIDIGHVQIVGYACMLLLFLVCKFISATYRTVI